jgi:phage terminase large subunit-like protein
VLADISGRYSPTQWARLAISAYVTHRADRIVAEVNNGGDMVGSTLRMVDRNAAFTAVRASRGKVVRAEPVAALYEQGRVHRIGPFLQLEDQMTNFTSDIDRAAAGFSPDRVDALVWAFSELLVESMESEGIYELARQRGKLPSSAANRNPLSPFPSPARCSGSRRRRRKAEPGRLPRRDVHG